ncbi:DUF6144 family protein [Wukongibacter baidiensis]|uniref:DUF6144 family protein n=1 Tax=Wukongibacter baidiensis TaxID=1723361 RepID=UPI003D7F4A8B
MKQIHNEAKKLYENVAKYSTLDVANKIAFRKDLPLCPTESEMKEWVEFVSCELEKEFEEDTIKSIRMGCHCTENGKLDESKKFIKSIYDDSVSTADFVDKMNEHGAGWYIEDGYLFTKYFSCPCPMLEGVDTLPTKTWCYCTVGYNKKIFEYVFDCEVDVELIESIKIGDSQCLMRIVPLSNCREDGQTHF